MNVKSLLRGDLDHRQILATALLAGAAIGAAATLLLLWRIVGAHAVDAWRSIPREVRVTLGLVAAALVAVGFLLFLVQALGDRRAFDAAMRRGKTTAPVIELYAGSISNAANAKGAALPDDLVALLRLHVRRYVIRARDGLGFKSRKSWRPVATFEQSTRPGDKTVEPALGLAKAEQPAHAKNLKELAGRQGLPPALVITTMGIGAGFTSVTRLSALAKDIAELNARMHVTFLVADPRPSAVPEPARSTTTNEPAAPAPLASPLDVEVA